MFSLGRHAGSRRAGIVALKERGRSDLVAPLARAMAIGIHRLQVWGVLGETVTVVPAPTRRWAARRRGGDPVTRVAAAAVSGGIHLRLAPVLRTVGPVRDSVGLDSAARERNIAGRVRLTGRTAGEVLLVDDVITTGATARESVRTLARAGVAVAAVLVLAQA